MNWSAGDQDDDWKRRAWSQHEPTGANPEPNRWPDPTLNLPTEHAHAAQSSPAYDWTATAESRPLPRAAVIAAVAAVAFLTIALIVALVVVVVRSGGGGGGELVSGPEMVTETSTEHPLPVDPTPTSVDPTSTSVSPTRASAPAGLVEECVDDGDSEFPRAGRGTEVTSCPFAISVREAYLAAARPGDPASIEARSPVTGEMYTMGCLGGEVVTCRGGNDAVVYIY